MRCEVRGRNMCVGSVLRNYVASRFDLALGRFESRIRRVTVDLSDAPGAREGVEKCCRIAVRLSLGRTLRLRLAGADLLAVIDCTADHLGEAMRRYLQQWRRRGPQPAPRRRSRVGFGRIQEG